MATTNAIGSSYPLATTDIAAAAITYAKIQNVAANRILGNTTGSPASVAEIPLGAGLSFSGGNLVATGGMTYSTVSGTTQTAVVNNGYITNNASLVTVTLPTIAAVGDVVEVQGLGAGGWMLAQNSSQLIHGANGAVTSTGVGGSLASTGQFDFVKVRCIVANTTWSIQGVTNNLTIA